MGTPLDNEEGCSFPTSLSLTPGKKKMLNAEMITNKLDVLREYTSSL